MTRSSSAEPALRQSKRKGTRSVSSLTPTQLARKRANDREAQRAIRARTKEHIERLERELSELKSGQTRDRTVHELLRRNQALELELSRLQEHVGISVASSPYSTPAGTPRPLGDSLYFGQLTPTSSAYEDSLSSGSGTVSSPRMSPLPSIDYGRHADYGHPYGATISNGCENWASPVTNPILSAISSPSSPVHCHEYNTVSSYNLPPAVSPSLISARPRGAGMDAKDLKMDYEGLDNQNNGFRLENSSLTSVPPAYVHHQPPPSHQHHAQHHQSQPQPPFSQPDVHSPNVRTDQWNGYPLFYPNPLDHRAPHGPCVSR